MELLVIIISKEEYFERVVSLLVEAGIGRATILESEGLGHFLAYEVPIFAGLRQLVGEKRKANRTILAVIDNPGVLSELNKLLLKEGIDFTKPGAGIIFTLPVDRVIKSE
ncbi:MAG: hypothetical protein J7K37_02770 [Candidatus Omnitrophica bacterium]|nr:hypothetical protein [Candidatus Omnitrophota bacterium]